MGQMGQTRGADASNPATRPDSVRYEYKVIPAPRKPKAIKGLRAVEDQFAAVVAGVMNDMASEQWEYIRADSMPCEEKAGLMQRVETYHTLLVFRRPFAADQKFFEPQPQKQITFQKSEEDIGQQDIIFASGRRAAAASVSVPAREPENSGTGTVLQMLRNRRARQLLDNPEDYSGPGALAAE